MSEADQQEPTFEQLPTFEIVGTDGRPMLMVAPYANRARFSCTLISASGCVLNVSQARELARALNAHADAAKKGYDR